jgi:hypothetical protein
MIEPSELAQESVPRRKFLTGGLAIAAAIGLSTTGAAKSVRASSPAALTTHNRRKGTAQ